MKIQTTQLNNVKIAVKCIFNCLFKICTILKYICFLMQGNCAFLPLNSLKARLDGIVLSIAEDIHTQLSSKVLLGKSYALGKC